MNALHLPVFLVLIVAVVFLLRKGDGKLSHIVVGAAFGFYLAGTSAASAVSSTLDSAVTAISSLM
ncbi:hypothetical protein GTY65_09785 [Streptomyces sp. SID8379]|uniref:hypothetical protein n=1 Tax=unclassified Streptomyces TaxID=2593676 RepID=UPI00035C880C|nr:MULTISPECIES: hypothetical protein [unclassified Streptomyces]MYW64360.1 hypothetical protein [Streptomyces sp. SID8379]